MSISNPGGISFNFKGTWSNVAAYNPGDVAIYSLKSYLNYQSVPAQNIGPTVDVAVTHSNGVNTSAIAVPLLSTNPSDLLCLFVFIQQQSAITVSGVADTTLLTWSKAWSQTGSNIDIELWTATAVGGIPYNGTITATFSGATGGNSSASAVAIAFTDATGGDNHSGLPATSTGTTPMLVSVAESPDTGIYVGCNSQSSGIPGLPSGFSQVVNFSNNNGLQNCGIIIATKAGFSGGVIAPSGGSSANLNMGDALTNAGASNPTPDTDYLHWIA